MDINGEIVAKDEDDWQDIDTIERTYKCDYGEKFEDIEDLKEHFEEEHKN